MFRQQQTEEARTGAHTSTRVPSCSSTSLPPLHSNASGSFENGFGTISMAVLANPDKIQQNIQDISSVGQQPASGNTGMDLSDFDQTPIEQNQPILEEERMHTSDVSRTDPNTGNQTFDQQSNRNSGGFFNIPQPTFDDANQTDLADVGRPSGRFQVDPFENRFTVPMEEAEASGIIQEDDNNLFFDEQVEQEVQEDDDRDDPFYAENSYSGKNARTQAVQMNLDNNVTNTFDNSTMHATQATVAPNSHHNRDRRPRNSRSSSESSKSSRERNRKQESIEQSRSATESDATAYELEQKENARRRKKKEKRRRQRLPHERTQGEWEEERIEDWTKQMQASRQAADQAEKRHLLFQFAQKESEGIKMTRRFNMNSDLTEMRYWYYKMIADERTDDEVAHLRSHLVEGTRLLLFVNENILENPLGLADMSEFSDSLSTMLVGKWDRHIRNYVKSRNGLQGPPPQPLKNLALNFLHLLVSHHRQKAAEEQKEKKRQEQMQRDAMMMASQQRAQSGVGVDQSPFDVIFGAKTSYMRGTEGSNPMQLPPYAEYEEFLQWKQQKNRQNAGTSNKPSQSQHSAWQAPRTQAGEQFSPKPAQIPSSFVVASNAQNSVPEDMQPPQVASLEELTTPSVFRVPASKRTAAPVVDQSSNSLLAGPFQTTQHTSFQSSGSNNSRAASSKTKKNNETQNSSNASFPRSKIGRLKSAEEELLLSTSRISPSSETSSSNAGFLDNSTIETQKTSTENFKPPPPSSKRNAANTLPISYTRVNKASEMLKKIVTRPIHAEEIAESEVELPPVPDIAADQVRRLQKKLAERAGKQNRLQELPEINPSKRQQAIDRAKEILERQQKRKTAQQRALELKLEHEERLRQQKLREQAEAERARAEKRAEERRIEQERIEEAQRALSAQAEAEQTAMENSVEEISQTASKTDSTVSKNNSSTTKPEEEDFESMMAALEAECEALDENEEDIANYNDVEQMPEGAVEMQRNQKDNKMIDMLTMFQNYMSSTPKGERPTAQSSMFDDLDSLLEVSEQQSEDEPLLRSSRSSSSKSSSRSRKSRRGKRSTRSASNRSENSSNSYSSQSRGGQSSSLSYDFQREQEKQQGFTANWNK